MPFSRHGGYILLEAMVALVLMSVGLASVMHALRLSLSAARHATHLTIACHLAEQKLAELRAMPPSVVGTHEGDFGPTSPGYQWRTTIQPVTQEAFYSVLVEIRWLEHGRAKRLTLGSLMRLQPVEQPWRSDPPAQPGAG